MLFTLGITFLITSALLSTTASVIAFRVDVAAEAHNYVKANRLDRLGFALILPHMVLSPLGLVFLVAHWLF